MDLNIVGIDFSLNSPAFCIYKNDEFFWGSLTRTDRTPESLRKSKDKPYSILENDKSIDLFFLTKKDMPEEYSERERVKIDYFQEVVDQFWAKIENLFENKDFYVAIEGLSFSSNGNSLIDISMATALIRKRIVDSIGSDRFYVFPPTAIKKFAGKGNLKKDEMFHSLVERGPSVGGNFTHFTDILSKHSSSWITNAKQVNKPIDDIVDASWICLHLKEILEQKINSDI